jgi:glycosyltransferase involved in cell wall biosynthesis
VERIYTVTIDVVIPAHNEEAYLGITLDGLTRVCNISNVIVVDDGSTDRTAEIAEKHQVKLVRLQHNKGKSAALMAGVRESNSDFILMLDADIGATAGEITKLIDAYPVGQNACVVALFPVVPGRGGGLGLAVRVARTASNIMGGWRMMAPLSGQRLLRRDTLEKIFPLPYGFGLETAMNVRLGKAKVHLIEVQTQMDHRVTQNDFRGRLHRLRQLIHLVMAIIRECIR